MKKKTVIAVLSIFAMAAAFGAAGCGDDEEQACTHSWLIKSQGDYHYSECKDCGEIDKIGPHVDEKNNTTQADGADGKCDTCGADYTAPSETVYEWKHDDDNHWKEIDGSKEYFGGHVDLKGASGDGADGKCDTCDAAIKVAVSFDLCGKGEADVKSVEYGSTVAKPEADPKSFGFVFSGWYSDYECKNEFDFTQPITAPTTVYAKWAEDTTPGYKPENPIIVELDTANFTCVFDGASKLYFKFTAAKSGRYELDLRGAAADKCAYVSDIDDDKYTVKNSGITYFDLDKDDSVVVEVTRGEGVAADANVSAYVTEVTNEPLPSGSYASGTYKNEELGESSVLTLVLDRTNGTAKWGDNAAASYNYVGGSIDKLTFVVGSATFTVKDKDGVLSVSCSNKSYLNSNSTSQDDWADSRDLAIPVEFVPIPVAKLSGTYKSENGLTLTNTGKVTEIGIYDNGEAYFLGADDRENFSVGSSAVYDTSTNILKLGNYSVTVNLDDNGDAVSINVKGGSSTVVYTRDGDVGAKLPAAFKGLENGAVYAGSGRYFTYNPSGILINDYSVRIFDYDEATETYAIKVNGVNYTVIIESETVEEVTHHTLKWKDKEGELIDTLKKYEIEQLDGLDDLKEAKAVTLSKDDFALNLYHFSAKEEGWYTFTTEQTDLKFYTMPSDATYIFSIEDSGAEEFKAGRAVYLTEGQRVAVSIAGYKNEVPAEIAFSIYAEASPLGYDSKNPLTCDKLGDLEIGDKMGGFDYYVNYTLDAGYYLVTVSYTDTTGKSYNITFTLNGENNKYGYDGILGYGGLSRDFHTASVQVEDGNLSIVISHDADISDLKVNVVKNYTTKANALDASELGAHDVAVFGMLGSSYVTVTAPADQNYLISIVGKDYNFYDAETDEQFGYNDINLSFDSYQVEAGQSVTIYVSGDNQGSATLLVEKDYTIDANFLEFQNIPMAGTIISFANGFIFGEGANFYLPDTKGSEIFVSASKAFTVNYPDGTDDEAVSENGSYLVTIPANEGIYFNISSEEEFVDLFFVTSYGIGSQGNPKNVIFTGASYTETVERGGAVYLHLDAGSYSFSSSSMYAALYLNGEEIGSSTFDVKDGDLLSFEVAGVASGAATLTINVLVPKSLRGDYTYPDGSDTKDLTIGASSVTVDGKTYAFSSVDGDVYTFVSGTGDNAESITITAGSTLLYGNVTLTSKTIPSNVVGTYTGKLPAPYNTAFTLVIKANYTAEFTVGAAKEDVTLKLSGSTYSFEAGDWKDKQSFTINPDGTISLSYNDGFNVSKVTLEKEVSINGIYVGESVRIEISDETLAYYFNGSLMYSGAFTEAGGTYTFKYVDPAYPTWGDQTATFKITNGNITGFVDNNVVFEETTLEKQ